MDFVFKCVCQEEIIKSQEDCVKIRSKVILIKGDDVFAVCKGCNTEIKIPLKTDNSAKTHNYPKLILKK